MYEEFSQKTVAEAPPSALGVVKTEKLEALLENRIETTCEGLKCNNESAIKRLLTDEKQKTGNFGVKRLKQEKSEDLPSCSEGRKLPLLATRTSLREIVNDLFGNRQTELSSLNDENFGLGGDIELLPAEIAGVVTEVEQTLSSDSSQNLLSSLESFITESTNKDRGFDELASLAASQGEEVKVTVLSHGSYVTSPDLQIGTNVPSTQNTHKPKIANSEPISVDQYFDVLDSPKGNRTEHDEALRYERDVSEIPSPQVEKTIPAPASRNDQNIGTMRCNGYAFNYVSLPKVVSVHSLCSKGLSPEINLESSQSSSKALLDCVERRNGISTNKAVHGTQFRSLGILGNITGSADGASQQQNRIGSWIQIGGRHVVIGGGSDHLSSSQTRFVNSTSSEAHSLSAVPSVPSIVPSVASTVPSVVSAVPSVASVVPSVASTIPSVASVVASETCNVPSVASPMRGQIIDLTIPRALPVLPFPEIRRRIEASASNEFPNHNHTPMSTVSFRNAIQRQHAVRPSAVFKKPAFERTLANTVRSHCGPLHDASSNTYSAVQRNTGQRPEDAPLLRSLLSKSGIVCQNSSFPQQKQVMTETFSSSTTASNKGPNRNSTVTKPTEIFTNNRTRTNGSSSAQAPIANKVYIQVGSEIPSSSSEQQVKSRTAESYDLLITKRNGKTEMYLVRGDEVYAVERLDHNGTSFLIHVNDHGKTFIAAKMPSALNSSPFKELLTSTDTEKITADQLTVGSGTGLGECSRTTTSGDVANQTYVSGHPSAVHRNAGTPESVLLQGSVSKQLGLWSNLPIQSQVMGYVSGDGQRRYAVQNPVPRGNARVSGVSNAQWGMNAGGQAQRMGNNNLSHTNAPTSQVKFATARRDQLGLATGSSSDLSWQGQQANVSNVITTPQQSPVTFPGQMVRQGSDSNARVLQLGLPVICNNSDVSTFPSIVSVCSGNGRVYMNGGAGMHPAVTVGQSSHIHSTVSTANNIARQSYHSKEIFNANSYTGTVETGHTNLNNVRLIKAPVPTTKVQRNQISGTRPTFVDRGIGLRYDGRTLVHKRNYGPPTHQIFSTPRPRQTYAKRVLGEKIAQMIQKWRQRKKRELAVDNGSTIPASIVLQNVPALQGHIPVTETKSGQWNSSKDETDEVEITAVINRGQVTDKKSVTLNTTAPESGYQNPQSLSTYQKRTQVQEAASEEKSTASPSFDVRVCHFTPNQQICLPNPEDMTSDSASTISTGQQVIAIPDDCAPSTFVASTFEAEDKGNAETNPENFETVNVPDVFVTDEQDKFGQFTPTVSSLDSRTPVISQVLYGVDNVSCTSNGVSVMKSKSATAIILDPKNSIYFDATEVAPGQQFHEVSYSNLQQWSSDQNQKSRIGFENSTESSSHVTLSLSNTHTDDKEYSGVCASLQSPCSPVKPLPDGLGTSDKNTNVSEPTNRFYTSDVVSETMPNRLGNQGEQSTDNLRFDRQSLKADLLKKLENTLERIEQETIDWKKQRLHRLKSVLERKLLRV